MKKILIFILVNSIIISFPFEGKTAPINVPGNMTVIKIVSDMASIAADLQTALRALSAGDVVFSIDIIRSALNNQVVAYISYEAAP